MRLIIIILNIAKVFQTNQSKSVQKNKIQSSTKFRFFIYSFIFNT